jgi:hypothetical protein
MRLRTDTAPTVVASFGSYNVVRPESEEKRIMLKKFLLFTIASLVMLPALADKPSDKGKGNKDGAGVPLDVVFRDQDCLGDDESVVDDKFCSDGNPYYIDGEPSVSTHIGKFRFGLNVGVNGPRHFFLDLTPCKSVSPMSCDGKPFNFGLTTGANVFATSPDGTQYLKMIVDAPKDVNFQLEFLDDDGKDWRIMFNPSKCPKDGNGNNLATMATVTKIDDDLDTWVFEAGTGDVACLQLREGGAKHWTFHGLYNLPFTMIATAK